MGSALIRLLDGGFVCENTIAPRHIGCVCDCETLLVLIKGGARDEALAGSTPLTGKDHQPYPMKNFFADTV